MTEENPYAVGPPPDYDPPPLDVLIDPEVQTRTRLHGRELCLAVLEESIGLRKRDDGSWTRDENTDEGEQ